ncbi:hypothetical protein G6F63_015592 [Rhizopus arrhizus]|nr:hypothetical protein G6F63_015592 [Rhizopus arrhizus]
MASSDNVTIVLEGVGGHGAVPHRAADPVVAGAAIVMGLQSIVARNIDPLHMAVITVGAFNAGRANNVIPQPATLKLSVRALDSGLPGAGDDRLRPRLSRAGEHAGGNGFRAAGGRGTGRGRQGRPADPAADRQRRLRLHAGRRARLLPACG